MRARSHDAVSVRSVRMDLVFDLIGTFREAGPEESLQRALAPHIWRAVGLTRLADITGLDHIGVHTFVAIRPNAKCLHFAGQGSNEDPCEGFGPDGSNRGLA